MSQQSVTNQIIANIRKTSTNFQATSFIDTQNVVCIDSSWSRIGVNTKTPNYSIEISGGVTDICYGLKTPYLYTDYEANLNDISNLKFRGYDISANFIDSSFIKFTTISGNNLDANFIKLNDLCTNHINIPNISCNYLDIALDVCCNKITTLDASIVNLTTNALNIDNITLLTLDVTNIANIRDISSRSIKSDYVDISDLSINNLIVRNNAYFYGEVSLNNLTVTNDSCFNKIIVNDISVVDICSINVTTQTISAGVINVTSIISNGNTIISDGVVGNRDLPNSAVFSDISIINLLDISSGKIITKDIDISGTLDISSGKMILPEHYSSYDTPNGLLSAIPGTVTFDRNNNELKIFNDYSGKTWNRILFKLEYATISVNKNNIEVSGNDISYNTNTNSYFIDNSNNLDLWGGSLNTTDPSFNKYKYIPIKFDVSFGTKFDISNISSSSNIKHKTLLIKGGNNDDSQTINDVFEIHANLGLKYINKIPGDIEPNTYTFGIYKHKSAPSSYSKNDETNNIIKYPLVTITNSILSFDNSHNYSNTSLSYIGPLGNSDTDIQDISGLDFYIYSEKAEVDFLYIDTFNCTIKLL